MVEDACDEMYAIFKDNPEVLSNTVEVCDKVEDYSIDNAPIMPSLTSPRSLAPRRSIERSIAMRIYTMNSHVMRMDVR